MKIIFTMVLLLVGLFTLTACQPTGQTATPSPQLENTEIVEKPSQVPSTVQPAQVDEPSDELISLTENSWYWISFTSPTEQYQIEQPQNYVLTFNQDGSINIKADCNNANADYMVEDQSLTITVGPMTKAMCPPDSRSDQFVKLLNFASIYFFEEGNLIIDLMADGGTMVFSRDEIAPEDSNESKLSVSPLTEKSWQWVSFTNPVEKYSIDNPQDYTLSFNPDGTVSIKADCNNAIGNSTVEDNRLQMEIGPMTMAQCPPGSLSDKFVSYLGYSALYFFDGGHLFIDLFADGGTLEFAPIE